MPTASRWSERSSWTFRGPTRTSLSTSCTLCESPEQLQRSLSGQNVLDYEHCSRLRRYSRGVMSPGRHVRTRLYFTSESHVHSLLSIFRYGGLLDVSRQSISTDEETLPERGFKAKFCVCLWQEEKDQQWKRAMDYLSAVSELNYMTQIVIMLYEDNNKVETTVTLDV